MVLRATDIASSDGRFVVEDPLLGTALRPHAAGWAKGENRVWVRINSDGMRDREHSLVAPSGTVRVAVLGDSYMQATNVPLEKTFAAFLERGLDACLQRSARRAEVLNFGVSGYGTAQELLTYRHKAMKYRPDVVLLAVYTSNDIFNNHRDLTESPASGTPYFVLRGSELILEPPGAATYPWYQRWRIAVTDRVLTARTLYQAYADVRHGLGAGPQQDVEATARIGELGLDEIYRPPVNGRIEEAWRVTEALLLTLAREVAAQGAELWIVTLTNAEQVHPDPHERAAYAAKLGLSTLLYPDHRIRDFAAGHGIPVITLAEPLADYAITHQVFLNGGYTDDYPPGTGHWNETANQLGARLVGERMCRDSGRIALSYPPETS